MEKNEWSKFETNSAQYQLFKNGESQILFVLFNSFCLCHFLWHVYLVFRYAASEIDRAMLNILEENARVLKQIGENIMTSQVDILL